MSNHNSGILIWPKLCNHINSCHSKNVLNMSGLVQCELIHFYKHVKTCFEVLKLVLRYPVNLYHKKLDKFNLVWNNPVMVKCIKQILDKTCLKQSCQFTSYKLDKSKLVWNNPVNSRHTKLDKSKLVRNNLGKHELTGLFKTMADLLFVWYISCCKIKVNLPHQCIFMK